MHELWVAVNDGAPIWGRPVHCRTCLMRVVAGPFDAGLWQLLDTRAVHLARTGVLHPWAKRAVWKHHPVFGLSSNVTGALLVCLAHQWRRGWDIQITEDTWRQAITLAVLAEESGAVIAAAEFLLGGDG